MKKIIALALTLAPLCKGIILDSECPQWEPIAAQLDAGMVVFAPHRGLADAARDYFKKQRNE